MRNGFHPRVWYWALGFLAIIQTARHAPGCCAWFQVQCVSCLSVCLSVYGHMCVGIILWLKTYHLHLDATKETDLFTARTKIWNLTHSLSEMTLKLCVIYLTLTCFILEPDRPLCLHLVFQPKYAYICIWLCVCVCICYTLCVACYSTFALGSKWLFPPPLRLHHQYLCRDVPQREAVWWTGDFWW